MSSFTREQCKTSEGSLLQTGFTEPKQIYAPDVAEVNILFRDSHNDKKDILSSKLSTQREPGQNEESSRSAVQQVHLGRCSGVNGTHASLKFDLELSAVQREHLV